MRKLPVRKKINGVMKVIHINIPDYNDFVIIPSNAALDGGTGDTFSNGEAEISAFDLVDDMGNVIVDDQGNDIIQ